MAYRLTSDEQARLDAVPWPDKLRVADQLDRERSERQSAAEAQQAREQHQAALAYAAHTQARADEETAKHQRGEPCDTHFCRYLEH